MQTTISLLILIITVCAVRSFEDNSTLCLFHDDNDCGMCTETSSRTPNFTLLGSNLTIQFCASEFNLDSVLTVAKSHLVTVQGMPSQLICTHLQGGMHIYEVTELVIRDVELISCGSIFSVPPDEQTALKFVSSIFILDSTAITIERVIVRDSLGNGVSMFDNSGTVFIHGSQFRNNSDNPSFLKQSSLKPSGSGLHIVLSYCRPRSVSENYNCSKGFGRDIINSHYRIENCTFSNNTGGGSKLHLDKSPFSEELHLLATGFGRGGGLCIIVDRKSTSNLIEVAGCDFLENSAIWGGGIYLSVLGDAQGNNITIDRCVFYKNSCSKLAGGGANVGFQAYNDNHPQGNVIEFHKCRFTENKAVFGGGVSFYSSSSRNLPNKMIFKKCNWIRNVGDIGAAVNISPQVWKAYIYDLKIRIIFQDCTFASNYLSNFKKLQENISYKKGRGIFSAVGYRIWFKGSNIFDRNENSALYLTSTEMELCSDSNTTFTNNKGFEGAAIYMLGFSSIIVNDDAYVMFANNSALAAGGAIFQHTYDTRDFFASQSCFIRYSGNKLMDYRNITFLFQNNSAGTEGRNSSRLGQYGHSIYATTVEPCYKNTNGCSIEMYNVTFTCIGNFIFENKTEYDISTAGKDTWLDKPSEKLVWVIPGKLTKLPIETLNDLGERVLSVYHLSVAKKKPKSSVSIDRAYTYLSDKYIRLLGQPGHEATLKLETLDVRTIVCILKIKLQECPPGYIYSKEKKVCECSVFTNKQFFGVGRCDDDKFQAKLRQGFWIGYSRKSLPMSRFGLERLLLHATCPLGHCLNVNSKDEQTRLLPENTSIMALDEAVCGTSRTGVLCSKCREGHASHYHHSTYTCKEGIQSCKFGWLLYLVSEIVPVTIFFIVVMVFNIKFTDGALSGFILFVQLSDTMLIKGNGYIQLPNHVLVALDVYRFITRIFNLNFFAIDSLSFCLWRNASTLDLQAFKYITILYASTLVVGIIAVFKYCHSKRLNRMLVRIKGESAASTKATIIHGVSGFLVICYSECTRISLLLLTPVPLRAGNEMGYYVEQNVAFYNGELVFFRGKHLLYALPALVIILVLGIFPPLLLMSYPLCYRVLTFFKISETRPVKILCKCVPLEKFKPFFDSFQSSYKDEYRFFSGLYFLYRFTTLVTFAFMSDLNTYYIMVQVQLAVILTVHSLCQPYRKRWHNILDSLLFVSLSIINAATLSNFSMSSNSSHYINEAGTVQVILLYLPLIYITAYSIGHRYRAVKHSEVMSAICYKLKLRKRASTDCATDYHRLSSSFSLDAVENRMKDNIKF